jgi:hypothetical protein
MCYNQFFSNVKVHNTYAFKRIRMLDDKERINYEKKESAETC